jgi:hypothetical protein
MLMQDNTYLSHDDDDDDNPYRGKLMTVLHSIFIFYIKIFYSRKKIKRDVQVIKKVLGSILY